MDLISINHTQVMQQTANFKPLEPVEHGGEKTAAGQTIVTPVDISPAPAKARDESITPRFNTSEEQQRHIRDKANSAPTLDDLKDGKIDSASAEINSLMKLGMKGVMQEMWSEYKEHGGLLGLVAPSESIEKLGEAARNIKLEVQYQFENAKEAVSITMDKFKTMASDNLDIAEDSFDVVYENGKTTVVGIEGEDITQEQIDKLQQLIDNPSGNAVALQLSNAIDQFNNASWEVIDHDLDMYKYNSPHDGGNPYVPESYSMDEVMPNGFSYTDDIEQSGHIQNALMDMLSSAREGLKVAIEDKSHFELEDPGLRALTLMREEAAKMGESLLYPPLVDTRA